MCEKGVWASNDLTFTNAVPQLLTFLSHVVTVYMAYNLTFLNNIWRINRWTATFGLGVKWENIGQKKQRENGSTVQWLERCVGAGNGTMPTGWRIYLSYGSLSVYLILHLPTLTQMLALSTPTSCICLSMCCSVPLCIHVCLYAKKHARTPPPRFHTLPLSSTPTYSLPLSLYTSFGPAVFQVCFSLSVCLHTLSHFSISPPLLLFYPPLVFCGLSRGSALSLRFAVESSSVLNPALRCDISTGDLTSGSQPHVTPPVGGRVLYTTDILPKERKSGLPRTHWETSLHALCVGCDCVCVRLSTCGSVSVSVGACVGDIPGDTTDCCDVESKSHSEILRIITLWIKSLNHSQCCDNALWCCFWLSDVTKITFQL